MWQTLETLSSTCISKVQISYKLTPPIMVSDSGFRIEDPVKHSVEQLITKLVMG